MRTTILAFLAVSAAAISSAADGPSLNGNWRIQNSIAGNESEMACTFVHQESTLTGKCKSEGGAVDLSGKVDGNKVSFKFKVEHDGNSYTLEYEGTVDAAKAIKGTVNVAEAGASGDFTATASN